MFDFNTILLHTTLKVTNFKLVYNLWNYFNKVIEKLILDNYA